MFAFNSFWKKEYLGHVIDINMIFLVIIDYVSTTGAYEFFNRFDVCHLVATDEYRLPDGLATTVVALLASYVLMWFNKMFLAYII
jgi:hypothetical protein